MAKVKVFPGLSQVDSWESLRRFTSMVIDAIVSEVNGKLDFGDNIRSSGPFEVVFPDAVTVVSVDHNLGRVPTGFIVIKLNGALTIYKPASPPEWTETKIYLRSSAAGTATIQIV